MREKAKKKGFQVYKPIEPLVYIIFVFFPVQIPKINIDTKTKSLSLILISSYTFRIRNLGIYGGKQGFQVHKPRKPLLLYKIGISNFVNTKTKMLTQKSSL